MIETHKSIREDDFSLLEEFRKLTELRKYIEPNGLPSFGKIVLKGWLDFYDYNVGAFFLKAYLLQNFYPKPDNTYCVRLWVQTIDDGDMGAWSKYEPLENATEKLIKVSELMEGLVSFPLRDELNEDLIKIGLYLDYE